MKTFPQTAWTFARGLLAEADRIDAEYQSDPRQDEGTFWTEHMKQVLGRLASEWNLRAIFTDAGASEFLLDLVWWQDTVPQGAVLACEMEWGNTRDRENNPDRVLYDFDKLLSFKAPFKLMLFDSYGSAARQEWTLERLNRCLQEFGDHRRGEEYLLLDVSPRREAWHCPIQRDKPDALLQFFSLPVHLETQPAAGYVDTDARVLEGLGERPERTLSGEEQSLCHICLDRWVS